MRIRLKIVPDLLPNEEGKWIDVDVDSKHLRLSWPELEDILQPSVPKGFNITMISTDAE